MFDNVMARVQEMPAIFGVSIGMALFVLALTAVLSLATLTGHMAWIAVWFEDFLYRSGRWGH